ncbi:O-methyltransferase [Eremococcus coleocola]|uniref:tRNA 5-hydroxyuridine methyltransferase n=1 Tax=Eremococcus coleocola ACS-139-V-Col8 TaxID=908337 RepID=E4KQV3_9LACT|nr:O-methyltransferase [Eremococcus coleocola]EFR30738.1 methyltransferase domain protein [Eremococcus coleocola ACS-139-V-Col8]
MLNEMMHRPIVMDKVLDFMRHNQSSFAGALGEIEAYANEREIPVIPHESAKFIDFLCASLQPQTILEIGTAIGFSASLMAQHLDGGGHLTTIDRYPKMFERAKENFVKMNLQDQITLLEGDAQDILPTLSGDYDLIFMDSAKAKYVDFLPECLRLLKPGGILLIDDVFQGGTVFDDESQIPKRVRKIHRKLNELFETVLPDSSLRTCLLPLGDGLMMIRNERKLDGKI